MDGLTAALAGTANTLNALQYALNVSQNNIDNATTAGYARQRASLEAAPFDPAGGEAGGVLPGPMADSRDLLAEADVWQQAGAQGLASAESEALSEVQNALPTSEDTGIPAALTGFFNAVSAWSVSPGDGSTAQTVMDAAETVAHSFNTTAAAVANVSQSLTEAISAAVDQINDLTTQLASLNAAVQRGGQDDAGLDAQIYNKLEDLSGLVNIQALAQQDGTVEVVLSGGEALVVGANQYQLSTGPKPAVTASPIDPQAAPHIAIYGADGAEVSDQLSAGTLAGQLHVRNTVIPAITGDAAQAGSLNQLASSLVAAVNDIVSHGSLSTGVPSAGGLFLTDPAHPASAAATLALDPRMSTAGLPAIDEHGIPNGVPLALAALAGAPQTDLNNTGYTAFYGNVAAQVGRTLNQAQSSESLATQSLAQARSLRQTSEGVDLNREAMNVLELQQNFQAAAKLVNTLQTLSQALIDMIH